MMRPFNYARTPPEAPEGLPVLVVRLVVIVAMARNLRGGCIGVNRLEAKNLRQRG
jgi:hypothetical protein